MFAFASSLCSAASFVMMRRLQKTPSAVVISVISIITIIMGVIVLTIIVFLFKEKVGILSTGVGVPESPQEILWLLANGLCGVFGQLCLTVSLKIEEAGLVSLARTIDILMAFIFQVAFLHSEIVHWTSIAGGIIVCFGVCISALRRWLRGKKGDQYKLLWLILNCGVKKQDDDHDEVQIQVGKINKKNKVCCITSTTSSLETLDGTSDKPIQMIFEPQENPYQEEENKV